MQKLPEFSVRCSEMVARELVAGQQSLEPNREALAALYEHLGKQTPEAITADLIYPGDGKLWDVTDLAELNLSAAVPVPKVRPFGARNNYLRIMTGGEISEKYILRESAQTIIRNEALRRRRNGIGVGVGMTLGVLGAGNIVQEAGSNWGFVGAGVGAIILGATSLYARRPYTFRPVPDLGGLESPIRVVPQG